MQSLQHDNKTAVEDLIRTLAFKQVLKRRLKTGEEKLALPRDGLSIARYLGIDLDPWQINAITAKEHDIMLCVTRQGGKGEVATILSLEQAMVAEGTTTAIISRSARQAKRLLRRIKYRYQQLESAPKLVISNDDKIESESGSEIISLPGDEKSWRGLESVDFLILDEGAVIPDSTFHAAYPMLATTNGRCLAMSSARGQRGWFWKEWDGGDVEWHRERITWEQIPRFTPEFIKRVRRRLGEFMFRQEYGCEFMDTETQLFASTLIKEAITDTFAAFDFPILGDPEDVLGG